MVVQTEEMQTSPKYCYQEKDKGDLNGFKSNFVSIKYLSQSDTGQLENAKEKKCMDTFEKTKKNSIGLAYKLKFNDFHDNLLLKNT